MKIKIETSHGSFNAEHDKKGSVWKITTLPQYEEETCGDFVTEVDLPATATEQEIAEAVDMRLDEEEAEPEYEITMDETQTSLVLVYDMHNDGTFMSSYVFENRQDAVAYARREQKDFCEECGIDMNPHDDFGDGDTFVEIGEETDSLVAESRRGDRLYVRIDNVSMVKRITDNK